MRSGGLAAWCSGTTTSIAASARPGIAKRAGPVTVGKDGNGALTRCAVGTGLTDAAALGPASPSATACPSATGAEVLLHAAAVTTEERASVRIIASTVAQRARSHVAGSSHVAFDEHHQSGSDIDDVDDEDARLRG